MSGCGPALHHKQQWIKRAPAADVNARAVTIAKIATGDVEDVRLRKWLLIRLDMSIFLPY
jgi:hypothetical protein